MCAALFRGRHTPQLAALQRLLPPASQDMRLLFFRVRRLLALLGYALLVLLPRGVRCLPSRRSGLAFACAPSRAALSMLLLPPAPTQRSPPSSRTEPPQACAKARQIALAPSPQEQQRLEQDSCSLFFRVAAVFAPGAGQAAFPGQAAAVARCAQQLLADLSGAGGAGDAAASLQVGLECLARLPGLAVGPHQNHAAAFLRPCSPLGHGPRVARIGGAEGPCTVAPPQLAGPTAHLEHCPSRFGIPLSFRRPSCSIMKL